MNVEKMRHQVARTAPIAEIDGVTSEFDPMTLGAVTRSLAGMRSSLWPETEVGTSFSNYRAGEAIPRGSLVGMSGHDVVRIAEHELLLSED